MGKLSTFITGKTRDKCLYHNKKGNVLEIEQIILENFAMFRLNPLSAFYGVCEEIIEDLVYKHGWTPIVRKISGSRLSGAMVPDLTDDQKVIIRISNRPVERCQLDKAIDYAKSLKDESEGTNDIKRFYLDPKDWTQKTSKEDAIRLLTQNVFNMVCANPRRHAHLLPS